MNELVQRPFVVNARARWVLGVGVVVAAAALVFGRSIQRETLAYAVAHEEVSNAEAVAAVLGGARDPAEAFSNVWRAGKISQRTMALQWLAGAGGRDAGLMERALPLVCEAALDADASVREEALGLLDAQRDPALPGLALAQLSDADPQLRILGLNYLGRVGGSNFVRAVAPLLNDPEPSVVVQADALLRQWTGQDFGARLRDAVAGVGGMVDAKQLAKINAAVKRWHEWWSVNQTNYPAAPASAIDPPSFGEEPVVADFALRDLEGRRVRLSDFKGKVVLLNFWTTWCTACLQETPRLMALRKQLPDDTVVLGICLDGAVLDDDDDRPAASSAKPVEPRQAAARVARTFGINYPILLDPGGRIGARFNGGELPTNVIIDARGRLRRRFIGGRSLVALEAMLAQARKS